MRLLSWNVNGLRSLDTPLPALLASLDADILCMQETRLAGADDPDLERFALVPGYSAYFAFCAAKSGYSGVATYVRDGPMTPLDAAAGLHTAVGGASPAIPPPKPAVEAVTRTSSATLPPSAASKAARHEPPLAKDGHDLECGGAAEATADVFAQLVREGRAVVTDHGRFVLINVYVPAGASGRGTFKVQVLHAVSLKAAALRSAGRHVVVAGDLNVVPTALDMAERVPAEAYRAWLRAPTRLWYRAMLAAGMVDSFRALHARARGAFSCWRESTRARENNFGVRIDLIMADQALFGADARAAALLPAVRGSDHCPALLELAGDAYAPAPPRRPPPACAAFLPRFAMRQRPLALSRAPRVKRSAFARVDFALPSAAPPLAAAQGAAAPRKRARAGVSGTLCPAKRQQTIGRFFQRESRGTRPGGLTRASCTRAVAAVQSGAGIGAHRTAVGPSKSSGCGAKSPPEVAAADSVVWGAGGDGLQYEVLKLQRTRDTADVVKDWRDAGQVAAWSRAVKRPEKGTEVCTSTVKGGTKIDLKDQSQAAIVTCAMPGAKLDENIDVCSSREAKEGDGLCGSLFGSANNADGAIPGGSLLPEIFSKQWDEDGAKEESKKKRDTKKRWSALFKPPPSAPYCRHGELSKLKTVGKAGPNKGRTFWSCGRAAGHKGDRDSNCNFFQWAPFTAGKPLPD